MIHIEIERLELVVYLERKIFNIRNLQREAFGVRSLEKERERLVVMG